MHEKGERWCPARIIKRTSDYLHGKHRGDKTEFICEITGKDCGYDGLLFKDEIINKEYVCLSDFITTDESSETDESSGNQIFHLSLPEIELYIKVKAANSVPTVQEQIDHPRKRYLDYALYAKHRGKIYK